MTRLSEKTARLLGQAAAHFDLWASDHQQRESDTTTNAAEQAFNRGKSLAYRTAYNTLNAIIADLLSHDN